MQVNKVGGYYTPKANFNNQVRTSNPISFGEEEWCGGSPDDYEQWYTNNKVEKFFDEVAECASDTREAIKEVKKMAKKAFYKGQESDFKEKKGVADIDGEAYLMKCTKGGVYKTITLNNHARILTFYFSKDAKSAPKDYKAVYKNEDGKLEFHIGPKATTCLADPDNSIGTKKIVFNKEGCIYEVRADKNPDSRDYKKAIIRKFPHTSKSQMIENVGWLDSDTRRTYSYDPRTKNWSCKAERIEH